MRQAKKVLRAWDEYYQEQMETSGANDLWDELPGDTQNSLENLGVTSPDWQSIQNLSPGAVFSEIGSQARTQAKGPLAAMFQVLFVILLCALMEGLKVSFGDRPLSGVVNTVGTLCVCAAIIMPIVSCIAETAEVIYGSSMFLMCYVPVLAGIMIARRTNRQRGVLSYDDDRCRRGGFPAFHLFSGSHAEYLFGAFHCIQHFPAPEI